MLSNNLNINNNNISDSLEAMNLIETDLKLNPEIGSNETQIQTQTQTPLKSNNNKSERLKECFLQNISDKTKKRITAIINEIEQFSDIEKLLLYMQLPNGSQQDCDPLKQKGPGNPFGKKADIEVAQTYTWIQSHLEEDATVSLPKQEVYEEYKSFCDANKFEPLCVADFGKAMKHVFPKVKPRRLGQRGNSKYCYSGLTKKRTIEAPELPILDTSAYDYLKNDKNLDQTDRNLDQSLAKCLFSEESETDAIRLIIEWASKTLNQNFASFLDLAKFLVRSVDLGSGLAITSKATEEKPFRSHSKSNNSSRRRDVQNQLQKKIHEKEAIKEQKKKLDINKSVDAIKTFQNSLSNSKGIRKNRKNSASKSSDEFESPTVLTPQNAITIKKEPEVELSPAFQTNQLIRQNRIHNKLPIPRTGTPSRITSAIGTSIIIVPTTSVRLASPQSSITTESTATTTVSSLSSSPLKPTTSKYKRIQPKPVNITRSDSESAVSVMNSSIDGSTPELFNTIAKRRHSVSVPIRIESAVKSKASDESFNEKQSQPKRQIEERESSSFVSTKKRHIDAFNTFILSNNTNSSGFDDNNSSNSLSPVSQELQTITSKVETIGANDIRIQEIESEALMDYFNVNSMSVTNANRDNDQWDCSQMTHKSAKLSQLRILLEKNLPNNTNNKIVQQRSAESLQSAPLEGYSELREAILRKNYNNSVQTFGTLKTTNDFNEQNVISISPKDKEFPKSRQIEGLVTSPVLDNMQCISTPTTKGSPFTSVDYFQASNQLYNENNVIYSSVTVQVPSVPPSPNARIRAFNFQPISPRSTPTIPENASIDMSAYNNYSYNSTTIQSPPQYRLNQQTVGVGPSQPSSEANSPFVSPRSTPTPCPPLSRSRHNSGQSNFTLRQTPLQSFDSGVSSISSSPFISPQPTPVPISRARAGTGGMQRSLSRARHSSGPGGPSNMSCSALLSHRSNSLSPMICDTFSNATQLHLTQAFNDMNGSLMNSVQSSVNKCQTPQTPNSPLSPIAVLQNSDMNPLNGSSNNDFVFNQESDEVLQSDWSHNKIKTGMTYNLSNRMRHSSNPYSSPSTPVTPNSYEHFSQEIFSFMKNSSNETSETVLSMANNKSVLNRCQSVPVHQMIHSNMRIGAKSGNQLSPTDSIESANAIHEESATISKSYPATPVCNQNFQFPPSPPSSTKQLQSVIGSDDIISNNVLESGLRQDLMVSGLQMRDNSVWNNNAMVSTQQNDNELIANSSTARRNLNDLLAEPPDDLQTTLEDLRDCDNDFSKFAQELEAHNSYDDLN